MPADSEILAQVQGLVPQVARQLNPAVTRAASAAAESAQVVADDKDRLARLDAAQKDPPPAPDRKGSTSALEEQQGEYDEICDRLPAESGEALSRSLRVSRVLYIPQGWQLVYRVVRAATRSSCAGARAEPADPRGHARPGQDCFGAGRW